MAFNIHDKKLAISRIPQADYATVITPAAGTYEEIITTDNPGSFWNREARKVNNKGHSTGNRFATESHVEAWDSAMSVNFEASSQGLGQHLLAALGAVTTTIPTPSYYKHAFSPLNLSSSMQLPAFSFVEKLAEGSNGNDFIWPSAVCESIELAGDAQSRLSAVSAWRGSGKKSSGSGVTWATHVNAGQGNKNFFYNTQSEITIGTFPGNGSPASMDCDLESWRFAYRNTLAADDGYRPGCPVYNVTADPESGVLRSECLLVDSEIEFEFTIRMQASDPRLAHFEAQTELEGSIVVTGPEVITANNHKLEIIFHLMKYNSHVRSEKNGVVMVTITPEILYSRTDSKIIEVNLYNDVTSYTT